ncbi:MAG TPA: hypothetical protein VFV27_09660, partial [Nevskiaceae bacterium]|nr:hypothetical protein [Nevskiaceae bacterium]
MADRADDIKQLFSHLGLDPGGYQELRTRNRPEAGAPAASPTPPAPTQTPAAVTPPPSRSHARDGAALAASLFGNVAAAVSSGAATRTPPAPAAVPAAPTQPAPRLVPEARVAPPASTLGAAPAAETPAPAVSPESTRRWSLIRAATEATPKVAQIRPDLRAARPVAPAPAAPPVARAEPPVIVLEGPLPPVGPTERLVEALQQDPEETTRRLSAMVARRRSAETE